MSARVCEVLRDILDDKEGESVCVYVRERKRKRLLPPSFLPRHKSESSQLRVSYYANITVNLFRQSLLKGRYREGRA